MTNEDIVDMCKSCQYIKEYEREGEMGRGIYVT